MIGIQLRKMVLLSLILSISIVPMMCEFVEDAEDIQGFTRFSRSRSQFEEEANGLRNNREDDPEATRCAGITCILDGRCTKESCGGCNNDNFCNKKK
ncbi:uncharacterized protein MELLADRAFT_124252 [Melampsora larici-populina 98AG31]|uniref:Secreted protein n=1 Tax=Melampsora larici-populina (strain 98AG31 / pathotype 3-4-7) TaxID=747676 RepID=F4SDG7_MELLP|nr:uncharacterized protein MELLADRAFT_124252 [Melampsora larici-populina 98AG31]EGF97311.1 secreted protein [Melampsora larici-populina 98AG31]